MKKNLFDTLLTRHPCKLMLAAGYLITICILGGGIAHKYPILSQIFYPIGLTMLLITVCGIMRYTDHIQRKPHSMTVGTQDGTEAPYGGDDE